MSADDRDSGAAQLLGNGGNIDPYTHHAEGRVDPDDLAIKNRNWF
jgi:hypothetical protein